MNGSESHRWELIRIRARNVGYTVVQLGGFALMFWSLFWLLQPGLVEYYQSKSQPMLELVSEVGALLPQLDQLSAIVVFCSGAAIVWLST